MNEDRYVIPLMSDDRKSGAYIRLRNSSVYPYEVMAELDGVSKAISMHSNLTFARWKRWRTARGLKHVGRKGGTNE